LDHDRLAEALLQAVADDAADDVRRAAGSLRDDDADRLVRIVLREGCCDRCYEQAGDDETTLEHRFLLRIRVNCSGGGGGNRTRVRRLSAVRTTCLAWLFELRLAPANRQADARLAASTDPPGEAATPGREADVNDAAPLSKLGLRLLHLEAWPISRSVQRLAGIRRLERNARRWRLKCFQMDLRGLWSSACPVLLQYLRRNQVAPVSDSTAGALSHMGFGRPGASSVQLVLEVGNLPVRELDGRL